MQQKVRICVPVHYGMEPSFAMALAALTHRLPEAGISIECDIAVGESLIPRSRNRLAANFLRSDATHMLFLDADLNLDPTDIVKMCQTGHLLVSAIYPKKRIDWKLVGDASRSGVKDEDLHRYAAEFVLNMPRGNVDCVDGCVPVNETGTGCMLIAREVFDRIRESESDNWYVHEDEDLPTHNYFDCPVINHRLLSEDFSFCYKSRKVNIQPMAYIDAKLGHIGAYEFRGDLSTMLVPKCVT